MESKVFGQVLFNYGFDRQDNLIFWNKVYNINISAAAYFEKDGIYKNQEDSFLKYKGSEMQYISKAEQLLIDYIRMQVGAQGSLQSICAQYTPRTLRFDRNGQCVILIDDSKDPDGGLAVLLFPD